MKRCNNARTGTGHAKDNKNFSVGSCSGVASFAARLAVYVLSSMHLAALVVLLALTVYGSSWGRFYCAGTVGTCDVAAITIVAIFRRRLLGVACLMAGAARLTMWNWGSWSIVADSYDMYWAIVQWVAVLLGSAIAAWRP